MTENQLRIETTHLDSQRQARQIRFERVSFPRKSLHSGRNILLMDQNIQVRKRPQQRIGIERFGERRALQRQDSDALGLEKQQQFEQLGGKDQVLSGGIAVVVAEPADNAFRHQVAARAIHHAVQNRSHAVELRCCRQGVPIRDRPGQRSDAVGDVAPGTGAVEQQLLVRSFISVFRHRDASLPKFSPRACREQNLVPAHSSDECQPTNGYRDFILTALSEHSGNLFNSTSAEPVIGPASFKRFLQDIRLEVNDHS